MSLIAKALTTTANAQIVANASSDTATFEYLINAISIQVANYCSRIFEKANYDEYYTANNRQILVLRNYPVVAVTFVKQNGSTLTNVTDYSHTSDDDLNGWIYRLQGWSGNYVVQGLTLDPVAGLREIEVSYTAGYLLPGDVGYTAGAVTSLPLELSNCVDRIVAKEYWKLKRTAQGLNSMSEGGLSYSFMSEKQSEINIDFGYDPDVLQILNKYRRIVVKG